MLCQKSPHHIATLSENRARVPVKRHRRGGILSRTYFAPSFWVRCWLASPSNATLVVNAAHVLVGQHLGDDSPVNFRRQADAPLSVLFRVPGPAL
jgi:hypothetical protein